MRAQMAFSQLGDSLVFQLRGDPSEEVTISIAGTFDAAHAIEGAADDSDNFIPIEVEDSQERNFAGPTDASGSPRTVTAGDGSVRVLNSEMTTAAGFFRVLNPSALKKIRVRRTAHTSGVATVVIESRTRTTVTVAIPGA